MGVKGREGNGIGNGSEEKGWERNRKVEGIDGRGIGNGREGKEWERK